MGCPPAARLLLESAECLTHPKDCHLQCLIDLPSPVGGREAGSYYSRGAKGTHMAQAELGARTQGYFAHSFHGVNRGEDELGVGWSMKTRRGQTPIVRETFPPSSLPSFFLSRRTCLLKVDYALCYPKQYLFSDQVKAEALTFSRSFPQSHTCSWGVAWEPGGKNMEKWGHPGLGRWQTPGAPIALSSVAPTPAQCSHPLSGTYPFRSKEAAGARPLPGVCFADAMVSSLQ